MSIWYGESAIRRPGRTILVQTSLLVRCRAPSLPGTRSKRDACERCGTLGIGAKRIKQRKTFDDRQGERGQRLALLLPLYLQCRSDPAQVTFGAAWILWGVGLFLLFAYLDDYRRAGAAR